MEELIIVSRVCGVEQEIHEDCADREAGVMVAFAYSLFNYA
jgi:hypothetical protein